MIDSAASAGVGMVAGMSHQQDPRKRSTADSSTASLPLTFDSAPGLLSLQLTSVSRPWEVPRAVLSVQLPDKTFQFEYPVSGTAGEQVQDALDRIRQRSRQQAASSAMLGRDPESGPAERDVHKTAVDSLLDQMKKLLNFQELLGIVAAFEEATEHNELRAKQQQLLRDEVSDWYGDELGIMRHLLRNLRTGPSFIRRLLTSGNEMLTELGIDLARDPSLRRGLQGELARVFQNDALPAATRSRAFSYLGPEERRIAEVGVRGG